MIDEDVVKKIEEAADKLGCRIMTATEMKAYLEESQKIIEVSRERMRKEGRREVTEEMGMHKIWYDAARDIQSPSELERFVRHLMTAYIHDYGTICHACTAAAIAAAWCVNKDPDQGGITGFQAGAIMWEFIQHWMVEYEDKPLRLTDYSEMLYPQMEYKFRTIGKSTWAWLQAEAQKNKDRNPEADPDVYAHWDSILRGEVPFGYKVEK